MIVVVGHFRLPADQVEAARTPIAQVIEATRAEDGCIKYAYSQDPEEPGLFHVSEVWSNRPALDAHFGAPHMMQWQAARAKLGILEREITAYTATDSEKL
ncbi:MAG: antibiotic biosynthesis monooxygenase [Sphingomonadaceae bacterium]|nr:antibiotic biosynthesis monooxygenase [Sphingomonadaceae bacterium]